MERQFELHPTLKRYELDWKFRWLPFQQESS